MIKKTIYIYIALYSHTMLHSSEDDDKKIFQKVLTELHYDIFAGHLVSQFPDEDIVSLINYINQPVDDNELYRRALSMRQSTINFHKHQSFPKVFPGNNIYTYLEALKHSDPE